MPFISKYKKQQHPFHMVTSSPWPFLTSFSILFFFLSTIIYLHFWQTTGFINICISLCCLIYCIFSWFSDIIIEGTFQGNHTHKVYVGLVHGMLLFIVSEIMFFFAFFWAFFHSSLIPSIFIGAVWPPYNIEVLNPWGLPFLNTIILLSSGVSLTVAHRYLMLNTLKGNRRLFYFLLITVLLGILFTLLQIKEYIEAPFSICSGIYGSVFFLATGFHGLHVLIGTTFLMVCLGRVKYFHFRRQRHLGFAAAAWYWHFVDVVWLFLFITFYWWGS